MRCNHALYWSSFNEDDGACRSSKCCSILMESLSHSKETFPEFQKERNKSLLCSDSERIHNSSSSVLTISRSAGSLCCTVPGSPGRQRALISPASLILKQRKRTLPNQKDGAKGRNKTNEVGLEFRQWWNFVYFDPLSFLVIKSECLHWPRPYLKTYVLNIRLLRFSFTQFV